MSTLHTVNKSPYERNALKSALDHVSIGDTVLLIEDGVLAARKGAPSSRRSRAPAAPSARSVPTFPRGASSPKT